MNNLYYNIFAYVDDHIAFVDDHKIVAQVSGYSVFRVANKIQSELKAATQKLVVFCTDGTSWKNGKTAPIVYIHRAETVGGHEKFVNTGDMKWVISGTLRRIDNDEEIVRISHLMRIGYENAYVDVRCENYEANTLIDPNIGKRKIVYMHIMGNRAYLELAPME